MLFKLRTFITITIWGLGYTMYLTWEMPTYSPRLVCLVNNIMNSWHSMVCPVEGLKITAGFCWCNAEYCNLDFCIWKLSGEERLNALVVWENSASEVERERVLDVISMKVGGFTSCVGRDPHNTSYTPATQPLFNPCSGMVMSVDGFRLPWDMNTKIF